MSDFLLPPPLPFTIFHERAIHNLIDVLTEIIRLADTIIVCIKYCLISSIVLSPVELLSATIIVLSPVEQICQAVSQLLLKLRTQLFPCF